MAANLIYLDNNATTPCAPEVVQAMTPFLTQRFGNPASPHILGRQAAVDVERARENIAEFIDCDPGNICFTAGATEANNLAILGQMNHAERRTLVLSAVEHKSVTGPVAALVNQGVDVRQLPVSSGGVIDLAQAARIIDEGTALVCVQAANNEVGTIQPLKELVALAHGRGALVHCDAAQALGKMPFSFFGLGVDTASFSAHKAYGPKGVGFLVFRSSSSILPIMHGGSQERGMRPGTLNVAAIVGAATCCQVCKTKYEDDSARIAALRDEFESLLSEQLPQICFPGASSTRIPGTTNILIRGVASELLLSRLPNLCLSIGSACNSGAIEPSRTILAMGYSRADAGCSVRISIGRYNSRDEILQAAAQISLAASELLAEAQRLPLARDDVSHVEERTQ